MRGWRRRLSIALRSRTSRHLQHAEPEDNPYTDANGGATSALKSPIFVPRNGSSANLRQALSLDHFRIETTFSMMRCNRRLKLMQEK